MRPLKVGDVVVLLRGFLDAKSGERAFVYEQYDLSGGTVRGASIITETGVDLGGFSESEQQEFLTFAYASGLKYKFKNISQVAADYRRGLFDEAIKGT